MHWKKIILFFSLSGMNFKDKAFINIAQVSYLFFRMIRKVFPRIKFRSLGHFLLRNSIAKIRGNYFFCRSKSEDLSIIAGIWENDVVDLFKPQVGNIVIDAGAHLGLYTFLASTYVGKNGKVIAMEPNSDNFKILRKNIKLNKKTNITPLNCALWSEDKKLKLYEGVSKGAHNSVVGNREGITKKYTLVNAITVDSLVKKLKISHVDWMKIDVERAELEVIKGARKTLLENNMKVIVECFSEEIYLKVKEFLKTLGYLIKPTSLEFYYFAYKK